MLCWTLISFVKIIPHVKELKKQFTELKVDGKGWQACDFKLVRCSQASWTNYISTSTLRHSTVSSPVGRPFSRLPAHFNSCLTYLLLKPRKRKIRILCSGLSPRTRADLFTFEFWKKFKIFCSRSSPIPLSHKMYHWHASKAIYLMLPNSFLWEPSSRYNKMLILLVIVLLWQVLIRSSNCQWRVAKQCCVPRAVHTELE